MKKITILFSLLVIALSSGVTAQAGGRGNLLSRVTNSINSKNAKSDTALKKADAAYESVQKSYSQGRISADSVVSLGRYHKVWSPELAERYFLLAANDGNPRGVTELGALYAFSPAFSTRSDDGLKLLTSAADAGNNDANCYLGLYYFNRKDYKKAKAYFDACHPMDYGIGYTALGSMYIEGNGVKEDPVKAREYYRQAALKGYPRGMALYGFNLRATAGGKVNYPDAFYWLYMAGDLGDDAARTTLYLPRRNEDRGDSEIARDANMALQWIEAAQSGKKIQNEPIYKEGFLPGLKAREQAAEQGDDWSRFYLGSMNYNDDFLNQNYARAIYYYEPIAQNAQLPANVLAVVNERLGKMYREGKGTKANKAKADYYTRMAAKYGSLPAYKTVEKIAE